MGCRGWLRSLGLGQYKALFRASEIDAEILPELTEIDLEKLGVPLGHRKRLLRAISGLPARDASAAPSASISATPQDGVRQFVARRDCADEGATSPSADVSAIGGI